MSGKGELAACPPFCPALCPAACVNAKSGKDMIAKQQMRSRDGMQSFSWWTDCEAANPRLPASFDPRAAKKVTTTGEFEYRVASSPCYPVTISVFTCSRTETRNACFDCLSTGFSAQSHCSWCRALFQDSS